MAFESRGMVAISRPRMGLNMNDSFRFRQSNRRADLAVWPQGRGEESGLFWRIGLSKCHAKGLIDTNARGFDCAGDISWKLRRPFAADAGEAAAPRTGGSVA